MCVHAGARSLPTSTSTTRRCRRSKKDANYPLCPLSQSVSGKYSFPAVTLSPRPEVDEGRDQGVLALLGIWGLHRFEVSWVELPMACNLLLPFLGESDKCSVRNLTLNRYVEVGDFTCRPSQGWPVASRWRSACLPLPC